MEAAVTVKATPAEFDLLRDTLRQQIAAYETVLREGSDAAPGTRTAARKQMTLLTDLLRKLQ